MSDMIRVGIVDDHALVRDGLRLILDRETDIEVVGEASDASAALALAASRKPNVMVVDITLGDSDGIALLRDLTSRFPRIRLVTVTMHEHEETVRQAFLAGAAGYVVKGAPSADLVAAVRAVARDQRYIHPVVASVVVVDSLRWLRQADRLSPREIEVLRLLTAGRTAAETGQALGISAHTVRRHIANVTDKAGVRGRVALTRYALEHHLVQDET
ncbi:MAG TPA: response regulator transcription factor [Methylomirabilota bacterium]|jgi:DNA-binding NarL/FixJ family response regulator|nr:response regulator transcription factor [Methylomirabilota bacterium]